MTEPEALLPRALALARTIAEMPPETLRYTKRCMAAAAGSSFEAAFTREHDEGFGKISLALDKLPRR